MHNCYHPGAGTMHPCNCPQPVSHALESGPIHA